MGTSYTLMGYNGVVTAVETQRSEVVRLELEGMSCASCAARIERRLNDLDGVEATVNYATDQAAVAFDPAVVTVDDAARGGRGGRLPRLARSRRHAGAGRRRIRQNETRRRCRADGAARSRLDGEAAPVRRLGVAGARPGRRPSCSGPAGPSTAPHSSTRGTAPPRWTRSSHSARSQPSAGPSPSCSREPTRTPTSRSAP